MATFGPHRETSEKLRVVIKLIRLDEITYISFYREVMQTFDPHFYHYLSCCTPWQWPGASGVAHYVRVLSLLSTQMLEQGLPFAV